MGKRAGCFALLVVLVSCECCVALPHDATDLSAVCDCDITIFDAHVVWSWTAVWSADWLVGFVALRPKSTAMVIAGRSVHLTTLFPGQA